MAEHTDRASAIKKLGELIKDIDIAMLTTVDADGTLRSRPMGTQRVEFDGNLWFFVGADSPKVQEIEREHQVNVSYAEPKDQRYVSVSGAAQLVRDRAKIDQLWNPIFKAWFPDGKDDPNIALLKVSVEQAEYWDAPSSTVVNIVGFAKSLVTGKQPDIGENEKIDL